MGPLIINLPSGGTLPLNARQPLRFVQSAEQSKVLLGEDVVNIALRSVEPLDLPIGSWLNVFGDLYTINKSPRAERIGSEPGYTYNLVLEGVQYTLLRVLFKDVDATGVYTGTEFSAFGDLAFWAKLLETNIRRIQPTWALGEVPTTPVKQLSFSAQNCLAVLQTLCKEFDTEFDLVRQGDTANYVLHFRKVGQVLNQTFEYGQGKGLYQLTRTPTDTEIITRLYAYGGTRNLPTDYRGRSQRLMLPGSEYLEKTAPVAAFGLIENQKTWDDIYPSRTGTVTSVGGDGLSFADTGLDFDLNEIKTPASGSTPAVYRYLQPGVKAKVQIQTGGLAGYTFEVGGYNHATKTITLNRAKMDNGLEMPSVAPFVLAAGDTYVLLDILMPDSYVSAAEARLDAAALAYYDQNCAPRVNYGLTIDEAYLLSRSGPGAVTNFFNLGDTIHVVDSGLAIDKASRILSYKRDIVNTLRYTLTVSDSYEISLIERVIAATIDLQRVVQVNRLRDSKVALYGWQNREELLDLLFDTDGYIKGEAIRPRSVTTDMIAVGSRSQQLTLDSVIRPNYNAQPNAVRIDAGQLSNYGIVDGQILTWTMAAASYTLTDNAARYIYARCHRTSRTDGVIVLDTAQRRFDDDATYYYFLLGVLHSVSATLNVRGISLTYGSATINGGFITAGRIGSIDGQTYFDLDTGVIRGNITFSGNEGEDTSTEQLEAELVYFRNVTIPNLRKSISGKVVSYFQTNDPNTWAPADRINHRGDVWYKTNTGELFNYDDVNNTWTVNSDRTAIATYELASKAKSAADGKIRMFSVQPFPPYDKDDLWSDGINLLKCIVARAEGQAYNVLDWASATNYDNTKVSIDNGIVTAGRIQLAGDNQTVVAGISGQGTADESVRFWAGTDYGNRSFAPFRVTQEGRVYARRCIALLSNNNVEQAGICGQNGASDGMVRFFAGSTYADRNAAPFRVEGDGTVTMSKGKVGKLTISDGGLVAKEGDSLVQVDVNRPGDGGAILGSVNVRSTNAKPNSAINIAGWFEAKNAGAENYAIYAPIGKSALFQALINGRASKHYSGPGNRTIQIDPNTVDYVTIYPLDGRYDFTFVGSDRSDYSYQNGKEVTLINLNDDNSQVYLNGVINGESTTQISGGEVLRVSFCFGVWIVETRFDNEFHGVKANIPIIDQ